MLTFKGTWGSREATSILTQPLRLDIVKLVTCMLAGNCGKRMLIGFLSADLRARIIFAQNPKVKSCDNWLKYAADHALSPSQMTMRIEIQTDSEEHRSPLKAPPNYQSPRVRLKLLSLFVALMLVLILMKEAKKPEHWQWMGFQQNPVPAEKNARPEANKPPDNRGSASQVGEAMVPQAKPTELAELIAATSQTGFDTSDYPLAGQQFWQDTFASLNHDDQRTLLRFVRAINERTSLEPAHQAQLAEFVASLENKRERFHERLMDQISYLDDDSPQKKKLNDELSASRKLWDERILPAWQSTLLGDDITMAQLTANQMLDALLYGLALTQIEDGTSLNRPDEGPAWLLAWQRVLASEERAAPIAVTYVQLTSQPAAYRGKQVTVTGWIRAARMLKVSSNELGLDHYYVLWLRPEDTNVGPYCVYAQRLPDEFPEETAEDVELNEKVQISGVFFKIRAYTAANNDVLQCPLILADSFQWNSEAAEMPIDSWTPSWWLIFGFLTAMPILAGIVAWWAFKSTETRRFVHGPNAQRGIEEALVELKKDPEIKTDLQRVQSLYDVDPENPDNPL